MIVMTNRMKTAELISNGCVKALENLGNACLESYEFDDYPVEELFPAMSTKRVVIGDEEYYIKMEVTVEKIRD